MEAASMVGVGCVYIILVTSACTTE